MSPFGCIADMGRRRRMSPFDPQRRFAAVICRIAKGSLDHLVGGHKQTLRHGESERLHGFEIDDEVEFGRAVDRQIARLVALQYPRDVKAVAAIGVPQVVAVAHQTAVDDGVSPGIAARDRVLCRQRNDLSALIDVKRAGIQEKCADAFAHKHRKGRIDLIRCRGVDNNKPHAKRGRCVADGWELRSRVPGLWDRQESQ